MTLAGHHADVVYKFEDGSGGFNATPNDSTFKVWGSNATMDTYEGSHEAVRVFNAGRTAAEIIKQVFDGAWSVTFELSEPPWWLAAVLGQPTSTLVSGSLYDYDYDLDNNNDPVSLRLYTPTDGFTDYEVLGGAVVASFSVDQSVPGSPEVSVTGAYAEEPNRQSTPSISIPALGESTYSNRHAEVTIGGTTVGRSQSTTLNVETGTEIVNEIGSEFGVDFTPKALNPDVTYDHIRFVGQSNDFLNRFKTFTSAAVKLAFDNGLTGEDAYTVDFDVTGALSNQWTESGRNDPEADLLDELSDMGKDLDVTMSTDAGESGNPPGITL